VYLIKLKLLMRGLSLESGQVAPWDDLIIDSVKKDFITILKDMKDLKDVTIPRSMKQASRKPILVVVGDGTIQAYVLYPGICEMGPRGWCSILQIAMWYKGGGRK
jgi:hypothetical protein